ncbi:UDP-2,3-diacylglucosamine diphosphatase [Pleomorphomonas sp. JP5]|uniref:UDP-2,3-diacylglucosamine diphosphatase n=1 Tax=Pleomorphomonas sp. JP5 TaxID=2942998 RepID=UPI002044CDC2|nr:UDP-2,3-diacylglucosamine diphosphatase [Pleomorphomonas sp. JP5]MCM5558904.1 UDP-2,3-diacylglucosamine diphosphatase [Pleomorphomonas sp. JP5]
MSEPAPKKAPVRRHRSLFLSDLHLGAIGARADLVLRFLEQNRADTYMLVGDILDAGVPFSLGRAAACDAVVEHLRRRHSEGAKLIYLIGNHDPEPSLVPSGRRLPVEARDEVVHVAADGRRYLVVHGHHQDRAFIRSHLLTRIGTYLEGFARLLCAVAMPREEHRSPTWGGKIDSAFAAVNAALHLGRGHERRLVDLARQRDVDGVICGHYHMAGLHDRYGLLYANCGDWVTSMTCLSEDYNGRLHLIDGRAMSTFGAGLLTEAQVAHA